jgi:hypothetical protein
MVVALIALFVAMGGASYAVTSIDSRDIKNNSVRSPDIKNESLRSNDIRNNSLRSEDIRRSTIQASDIGSDALGGASIRETSLGKVPSASDADKLGGNLPSAFASSSSFKIVSAKLADGQSATLVENGPVKLYAKCDTSSGPADRVRIIAETSTADAFMDGADDLVSGTLLQPGTPEDSREMSVSAGTPGTALVQDDIDDGFVMSSAGHWIGTEGESLALGLNAFGAKCSVIGPVFVGRL